MWINPVADNSNQSKICPNCGQDNDIYGLPIYPFNKSTKVLNWCTKCLGTVDDITTVDRELPVLVGCSRNKHYNHCDIHAGECMGARALAWLIDIPLR